MFNSHICLEYTVTAQPVALWVTPTGQTSKQNLFPSSWCCRVFLGLCVAAELISFCLQCKGSCSPVWRPAPQAALSSSLTGSHSGAHCTMSWFKSLICWKTISFLLLNLSSATLVTWIDSSYSKREPVKGKRGNGNAQVAVQRGAPRLVRAGSPL